MECAIRGGLLWAAALPVCFLAAPIAAGQTNAPENVRVTPGPEELVVTWDYTDSDLCSITGNGTGNFEIQYRKEGKRWRAPSFVGRSRGTLHANDADGGAFYIHERNSRVPPQTIVIGRRQEGGKGQQYSNEGDALTAFATYYVRIRAFSYVTDCWDSAWTDSVSAIPRAFIRFSVTPGDQYVLLSARIEHSALPVTGWSFRSSPERGILERLGPSWGWTDIFCNGTYSFPENDPCPDNTLTYTVEGTEKGRTYYFQVEVRFGAHTRQVSAILSTTPRGTSGGGGQNTPDPPATPPASPPATPPSTPPTNPTTPPSTPPANPTTPVTPTTPTTPGGGNTGGGTNPGGGNTGGGTNPGGGTIQPPANILSAPQITQVMGWAGRIVAFWKKPNSETAPTIARYALRYRRDSGPFTAWTDIPESGPGQKNRTSYITPELASGLYTLHLRAVQVQGTPGEYASETVFLPTSTHTERVELPEAISLLENYPNPFNSYTTIAYDLVSTSHVRLSVYDARGRLVKILQDGVQSAGNHAVRFDAAGLPTGIYACHIETETGSAVRSMALVR